MTPLMPLGLLLAMGGSICIYLASPHQRWRSRPLPGRAACGIGALLLAAGLACLLGTMQGAAAVFVLLTWLMLLWVLWPYLGALRTRPPEQR